MNKITRAMAEEIRRQYATGLNSYELGAAFNTSQSTISNIVTGRHHYVLGEPNIGRGTSKMPLAPPRKVNLPGNGPWRILDLCDAPTHNSIFAAKCSDGRPKCICPHALTMLRAQKRERRPRDNKERQRKRLSEMNLSRRVRLPGANPEPTDIRMPDLNAGLCRTPNGMRIADEGLSTFASQEGVEKRNRAKALCGLCPVKARCLAYILAAEKPASSFGGVWGGLDPWNRIGKQMVIDEDGGAGVVPFSLDEYIEMEMSHG